MDSVELQNLIEQISLQCFNRPFLHQIKINRRMTTTGGRYHLDDHHIEINAHFLAPQYHEYLVGIIKHELCHYHLHLNHRGYQHRDHDFKVLLQKVGGSRYSPSSLRPDPQIVYECRRCHKRYYRQRHFNVQKYRCSRCGGYLKLISK